MSSDAVQKEERMNNLQFIILGKPPDLLISVCP